MRLALILALIASPALAGVDKALDQHVLPRHAALAENTAQLAEAAEADCTPEALRPAFGAAYDSWVSMSHITFGPIEDRGLSLSLSFWPDPKDRVGKALGRLIADRDPIVEAPGEFAEVSAAAQGFTALERLLYDPQQDAEYACALTTAIARQLAANAAVLAEDWPAFARLMTTAGEEGNSRFQSKEEATRALYTALSTGLEFLQDARLGRPLGTFDRPRPTRAEARRSARAQRHVELSLAALKELADHLHDGPHPGVDEEFAAAMAAAARLDDPALAGVADPASRIRVESLHRAVGNLRNTVNTEIGKPLGITAGFNALDGD